MGLKEEIRIKEERVRGLLEREGLDAVILTNQNSFAWFTAGGDNHIVTASDAGFASIIVTKDVKYIVTTNIEAARIMDEEVLNQGFQLEESNWYEPDGLSKSINKITRGMKVASDNGIGGTLYIADKLAELRFSLTAEEMDRYRWLGKNSEQCMNAVCRRIKQGDTEHKIAGMLAEELYSRGIMPVVLLVAADERIKKYRHPIDTDKKVNRYVMNVICARKWGLIIACTRLVHFGKLPDELRRKHDAVVKVDAAFNLNTKVGAEVREVLRAGLNAYKETGFAEEWHLHHQGGPTGYAPRDYLATLEEKRKVVANQAFAWNPSITGTKLEDTIIATKRGIEWLSLSSDWPMIDVEYNGQIVQREDILVV